MKLIKVFESCIFSLRFPNEIFCGIKLRAVRHFLKTKSFFVCQYFGGQFDLFLLAIMHHLLNGQPSDLTLSEED